MNGGAWFSWISAHPQFQSWVVLGAGTLAGLLALRPWWNARTPDEKRSDWRWSGVILLILLAGRWPSFFVPREFNTDESQLLAGARVLVDDPVFCRSVSGGTAGPLDFFALLPVGAWGGWESYLTGRLTAWLLLSATLILTHQAACLVAGPRIARLAGLAPLFLLALSNSTDLLHYATELVPLVLLAGASYAAARRATGGGAGWNAAGGFLLGAVLVAKLQVAPLAALLGLTWTWVELRQPGEDAWRRRIYLVGSALLPPGLFAFQAMIAGLWNRLIICYPLFTISYASEKAPSWFSLLHDFLAKSRAEDSLLHLWVGGMSLGCLLLCSRSLFRPARERGPLLLSAIALAVAVASILFSGRSFLHYWYLAILPSFWLATFLLSLRLTATTPGGSLTLNRAVATGAALLLAIMVGQRLVHPNPFVPDLAFFREHPRTTLSERVFAHSRPGESIAIWGWSNYVYVETGLRQATNHCHFGASLVTSPYRNYFRALFLTEVVQGKPDLFLDSTGPDSRSFPGPVAHDQNFPELAAVIRADYELVETIGQSRLYRHRAPAPPQSSRE